MGCTRAGLARRARAFAAAAVAAVLALAAAAPAASAKAGLDDSPEAGRQAVERLIREFSEVSSRPEAPEDLCLAVYLNDEEIVALGDDLALVPASLTKIATAAAALEVIGADAVYTTQVYVRSDAWDAATGGVLQGDLYLVGAGDPVLNTPRYVGRLPERVAYTDPNDLADRVLASLSGRGISRIVGRVIGDESHFGDGERDYANHYPVQGGPAVWKASFPGTNLVGPLSGLLLNDGYAKYSTASGAQSRRSRVRAADPAQHAASVFDDLLEARGMVITKRPQSGTAPDRPDRASLGSVDSPPLERILARMLSNSDNTIAEMVLKEIGRRTTGSARAEAVKGVGNVLARLLGASAEDVEISDGSGLSSYNRFTCDAVARLLLRAGAGSPLVDGLALAGETGTLRRCGASAVPGGGEANEVLAKTGALNDSTGLAGVAVADNGDVVTFAMIANETLIIQLGYCNALQRLLLNAAAHYTYGPAGGTPGSRAPADDKAGDGDEDDGPFDDIAGSVHTADIAHVAGLGIMRDCDDADGRRFCPDEPVRRERMAAFLARALALGRVEGHRFEDTWASPYAAEIEAVAAAGITLGCDATGIRFCPDGLVSRAQMAAFLVRAFKLPSVSGSSFTDTSDSVLAAEIEALAAAGITRGCDRDGPRFCPHQQVTRGQMASFLSRALNL